MLLVRALESAIELEEIDPLNALVAPFREFEKLEPWLLIDEANAFDTIADWLLMAENRAFDRVDSFVAINPVKALERERLFEVIELLSALLTPLIVTSVLLTEFERLLP